MPRPSRKEPSDRGADNPNDHSSDSPDRATARRARDVLRYEWRAHRGVWLSLLIGLLLLGLLYGSSNDRPLPGLAAGLGAALGLAAFLTGLLYRSVRGAFPAKVRLAVDRALLPWTAGTLLAAVVLLGWSRVH